MSIDISVQIDSDDILSGTNESDRRQLIRDIDSYSMSMDFSLQTITEIAASLMKHDNITQDEIVAAISKATGGEG